MESIQKCLATWKAKLLNHASRFCLVKLVLASLLVYQMQLFLLPKTLCENIDRMAKNFIWSQYQNTCDWDMVSWDKVTIPKAN